MRKPYIEIISEVFKDWHKDLVDQGFKLVELFDKIIVWLIGLSTGAVVLIFSSLDKLILIVNSQNAGKTVKRRFTNIWMKQKDV